MIQTRRHQLGLAAAALSTLLLAGMTTGATAQVDPAEAFDVLVADVQQLDNLPATPFQPFEVNVNIDGEQHTLLLGSWSTRADNFKVFTIGDDGVPTPFEAGPPLTVRGGSLQDPTIVVSGSLLPEGLKVIVTRINADERSWGIEPLSSVDPQADRSMHVVYRGDESLAAGLCGNDNNDGANLGAHEGHNHDAQFGDGLGNQGVQDSRNLLRTQIAHDVDFQYYQLLGSNENNVINDVENIMAATSAIYERDAEIIFETTEILIRTSSGSNPYTSNAPQTLLNQFRTQWLNNHNTIPRDIAHLWTGRNVDGSVIGIAYTIGGICTSSSYCLSQSRFTGNFNSRVALTTHEIGHVYGAFHCNQNPYVNNPCLIMCSGLGGCNGLGLPGFGPQSINFITTHAASRTCLDEVPSNLVPPIEDLFDTTVPPDPSIWETVSGATTATSFQFPPSGFRTLRLTSGQSVTSLSTTLAGTEPIYAGLWAQANSTVAGDAVVFEYFSTTTMGYEELIRFDAVDGTPSEPIFTYKVAQFPEDALSGDARFRIRSLGGTWSVDSMRVGDVTVHGLPFDDAAQGPAVSKAHWSFPNAVDVQGSTLRFTTQDNLTSLPIRGEYFTNDSRPLFMSFIVEHNSPGGGMELVAEVSDGGAGWTELARIGAGGPGSAGPELVQAEIPLVSQTNGMRVRIRNVGPIVLGSYLVSNILVGDSVAVEPPVCVGDIADDFGTIGGDGQVSFGDFLGLLGLIGPCPGGTPGCDGDIADDFGTLGGDGQVSFGDFLGLLGLIGPCP